MSDSESDFEFDFVTPRVVKKRVSREVESKKPGREKKRTKRGKRLNVRKEVKKVDPTGESGCGSKKSEPEGRRSDALRKMKLALMATASIQEKNDIDFVIGMERGGMEYGIVSGEQYGRDGELELRKREILDCMRKRKKKKQEKEEENKRIKNMVTGEYEKHRIQMILFALEGKRRCGEDLPCEEELSSYIFKRGKGKEISAKERSNARDILKHIVMWHPVDKSERSELIQLLRGALETEKI